MATPIQENDSKSVLNSDLEERVQHVSIKAPLFSEGNAIAWFSILSAQFEIANIQSDRTKFFHALSSLPTDVVGHLPPDILSGTSFSKLQEAVVNFYEKSKLELFERLISTTVMTGRPSIFLQELSTIAGKVNVGEDLLRHKFLQALPPPVNSILGAQRELPLRQLGNLADELLPLSKRDQCAAISAHDRMENVTRYRQVEHPFIPQTRQPNYRQDDIPIGDRPFKQGQRPRICRSHLYFADSARTCKVWCRWPNKTSNLQILPNSRAPSPAARSGDASQSSRHLN